MFFLFSYSTLQKQGDRAIVQRISFLSLLSIFFFLFHRVLVDQSGWYVGFLVNKERNKPTPTSTREDESKGQGTTELLSNSRYNHNTTRHNTTQHNRKETKEIHKHTSLTIPPIQLHVQLCCTPDCPTQAQTIWTQNSFFFLCSLLLFVWLSKAQAGTRH